MKQHHNSSPEDAPEGAKHTGNIKRSLSSRLPIFLATKRRRTFAGVVLTLCILLVFLVYSSALIVLYRPPFGLLSSFQPASSTGLSTGDATATAISAEATSTAEGDADTPYLHAPIRLPGGLAPNKLHLSKNYTIVYEDMQHIYTASSSGTVVNGVITNVPVQLETPGFTYNRAVPPVLTSNDQLIYGGDTGIWLMDLHAGTPAQQLVSLTDGQVLTSLKVSHDGSTLAYSATPADGSGQLVLYAGPLHHVVPIYHESASRLPSFRIFNFLDNSNSTLLLSDDRGDHRSAWYGLWSLTFSGAKSQSPRALLLDQNQQGPLAISSEGDTVLYSTVQGYVPSPAYNVPDDITSVTYANGLAIGQVGGSNQQLVGTKTLIPSQGDLSDTELYRWIEVPSFSPDNKTVAYVEFSSQQTSSMSRMSALYTISPTGSGGSTLIASGSASYIELDGWLDNNTMLFYASNTLYAFNIHTQSLASIIDTGGYSHVIGVLS